MATLEEALELVLDQANREQRTIMPGNVTKVTRELDGEQDADFQGGIADIQADGKDAGTPTPGAPRLNLVGGGYYFLLPIAVGDRGIGLVSDRALDQYRDDQGSVEAPTFERLKDDSDLMIAPLAITAPSGAPTRWDHPIIGGPEGPAIELLEDGEIELTKQGATVATITMAKGGSITLEVVAGQSVNIGGPAGQELAQNDPLVAAIDVFIAALVAAGAGPTYAGAGAAQIAWEAVKNTFKTTKAKGE